MDSKIYSYYFVVERYCKELGLHEFQDSNPWSTFPAVVSAFVTLAALLVTVLQIRRQHAEFVNTILFQYFETYRVTFLISGVVDDSRKSNLLNYFEHICWLYKKRRLDAEDLELLKLVMNEEDIIAYAKNRSTSNKSSCQYYLEWLKGDIKRDKLGFFGYIHDLILKIG